MKFGDFRRNFGQTGGFSSSSALLTSIYDTTVNNYVGLTTGGMTVDCALHTRPRSDRLVCWLTGVALQVPTVSVVGTAGTATPRTNLRWRISPSVNAAAAPFASSSFPPLLQPHGSCCNRRVLQQMDAGFRRRHGGVHAQHNDCHAALLHARRVLGPKHRADRLRRRRASVVGVRGDQSVADVQHVRRRGHPGRHVPDDGVAAGVLCQRHPARRRAGALLWAPVRSGESAETSLTAAGCLTPGDADGRRI